MTLEQMRKNLKDCLSGKRYEHTNGVAYTCACLAMRYGADMDKAYLAGLLHDCAKHFSSKEKIKKCEKYGLPISEYERVNPELLHAKLGAAVAKDKYGVDDEEILSAITWHTTGKPAMSLMDKIVYIADFMEPNRDQAPNLPDVRALAFQDLDACLLRILKDSVAFLSSSNKVIDPMTQETYEYYNKLLS